MIERQKMGGYDEKLAIQMNEKDHYRGKRGLDIVGSFVGLLVLSPILVVVWAIIKLGDLKSPALYVQERIGYQGKPFRMYKFRSMHVHAEDELAELLAQNEMEGALFKIKEDPRITKIGRWLRKSSLDEFPQLWNVLRGDMSLVGPRPCVEREVKKYTAYEKKRLVVRPGCTGLWQVSGRSTLHFKQMVELDLDYVKKQSLSMDLKILLKTVAVVLKQKGAY